MTKEQIQVYTKRITQANTSGLAGILYELTSIYIEEGKTAYKADRAEEFERSILQAQSFLQELMSMSKMEIQLFQNFIKKLSGKKQREPVVP